MKDPGPADEGRPMKLRGLGWGLVLSLAVGCAGMVRSSSTNTVRRQIEAAIARSVEATRAQDIDAYMAGIPDDAVVRDESGEIITRDQQRANTLRDWSIIPETLSIGVVIDRMDVNGDVATVFTSQRWERRMLRRDGATTDTVLTKQKHKETWRRSARGWLPCEIDELGGEVFVNGEKYEPEEP